MPITTLPKKVLPAALRLLNEHYKGSAWAQDITENWLTDLYNTPGHRTTIPLLGLPRFISFLNQCDDDIACQAWKMISSMRASQLKSVLSNDGIQTLKQCRDNPTGELALNLLDEIIQQSRPTLGIKIQMREYIATHLDTNPALSQIVVPHHYLLQGLYA